MENNFDPMTGEPIKKNEEMNFDPMTGEPIKKEEEVNFDPMTGKPIQKTAPAPKPQKEPVKFKFPKWGILAVPVAVVVIVVAMIANGAFLGKGAKIAVAAANTFKEQPQFLEDLKLKEMTGWVNSGKYTVTASLDGMGATMGGSIGVTPDRIQAVGELEGRGIPEIDFIIDYDKTKISAQVPSMSDYIFFYNYVEEADGDLMDVMDEDDIELINSLLSSYWEESKDADKMTKEITKAVSEILGEIEIENADKESFEVDGKKRDCKGYEFTVTEDEVLDVIDAVESVLEENVNEEMADILDDLFDELSSEFRNMPDIECGVYIYKNALAAVCMEIEGEEVQLLFKGGDYRIQNVELASRYDGFTLETKKDGSKEETELSYDGEELFVFEYDTKSGEFSLEADGEELEGKLEAKGSAITLSGDLEGIDWMFGISKNATMQELEGDELDLGNASQEEIIDAFEDLEDLMDYL